MIPLLTPSELRSADARTIALQGISAWDLMERAAVACSERILARTSAAATFTIVAGTGNNGGDGLAIARHLHRAGRAVQVYRVPTGARPTDENRRNWELLEASGAVAQDVTSFAELPPPASGLLVDALLGWGVNRPPEGPVRDAIRWMGAAGLPIISIDLPSGAPAMGGADQGAMVFADLVLAIGTPKLHLLLAGPRAATGGFELVPIGLDLGGVPESAMYQVEAKDICGILERRPRFGHKGTFGHALLMVGGRRYAGAALLAVHSALRSGCGLVSAALPDELVVPMRMAAPEAIAISRQEFAQEGGQEYTALGAGPGLGTDAADVDALLALIARAQVPMVLDADALNILAAQPMVLEQMPPGTILTPHPKEFDRLFGAEATSGLERLQRAKELACRIGAIIVLKGAYTATCTSDGRVFFGSTGNDGMARGGAGDVLTGLLCGLLAQGYAPLDAALAGVHLHGLAGDLAARSLGKDGMTVGDLIAQLPFAWQQLRAGSEQPLQ